MNQSNLLSPDSSGTTIGVIGIVTSLGGIEAVTQVLGGPFPK